MGNTAAAPVVLSGEWLSMQEAAAKLGKSPKTIEAMVAQDRIKSTLVPRARRKPERIYEAADVQRLATEAADRANRPKILAPRTPKPTANVQITRTEETTGKVQMTFEVSFPNEECEARDRAFELIGRIMREALPTQEERKEFLSQLEDARRDAFRC